MRWINCLSFRTAEVVLGVLKAGRFFEPDGLLAGLLPNPYWKSSSKTLRSSGVIWETDLPANDFLNACFSSYVIFSGSLCAYHFIIWNWWYRSGSRRCISEDDVNGITPSFVPVEMCRFLGFIMRLLSCSVSSMPRSYWHGSRVISSKIRSV